MEARSLVDVKCLLKRREKIRRGWAICPMRVGVEKGDGPEPGEGTVMASA